MRRRFHYEFQDDVNQVTKGFISTLEQSCISIDTAKLLANNSRVFRPCAYHSTDLMFGGFVRMEIPEPVRPIDGFGGLLSRMMVR